MPANTDHPAQNQAYLDWTEQLSQTVTVAKTILKTLTQSQTTADIRQYTQIRYEMLASNKKAMIRNILERPKRSIILNKLITSHPDPKILFKSKDILTATKQHFEQ